MIFLALRAAIGTGSFGKKGGTGPPLRRLAMIETVPKFRACPLGPQCAN
jgi:hypothetical protein